MKRIAIFFSFALALSAFQMATTKKYPIQGKITNTSGEPLIGVSILIKGSSQGAVTDLDGHFMISSKDSCTTLVVSYTGFESQEVLACTDKKINLSLMESVQTLEEVVVTEYSKRERKNSIKLRRQKKPKKTQDRISSQEISRFSYTTPAASALQGKAQGRSKIGRRDQQPNYNTEDYDHITENRFLEVNQNPLSTFSIDVDAASYSNLRRFIKNGQTPPVDAVRIEEMVNYFNYDYPQPDGDTPFTVVTELSECPWQKGHKLLHIGLQGKKIATDNLPASNLVFLIDVSGSMNSMNKLPLLQSSFKLLTDQLRPQDKVAIVVYAGAAGLVLPSTNGMNKQKIKEAIGQLQAGGSTAGGAGIELAYKVAKENFVEGGNNRVILATDGDFNIGASSDAEMVRLIEEKRESGIFLTVLGFGMGNYKDNKMQKLANKGNGNHAYIDDIKEAKKVLVNEFGGTMFTIAKDVKIQIEFNPTKVKGYRLIGYENRMLNKEDFNDDKKDAGELGAGHTVTAMYEIIPNDVASPFLTNVDPLKYQQTTVKKSASKTKELMTVKLRYKKPAGQKSKLIEKAVKDNGSSLNKASNNFRWAAATAQFGMLLRNSEFKGTSTYANALRLAKNAKGEDPNNYRQEMIDMMEVMRSLVAPELAGK